MAVGDVTSTAWSTTVEVLTAATATSAAPTLVTQGVDLNDLFGVYRPATATFALKSTAGSGTMTVTIKAWGWHAAAAKWLPLGTHSDGTLKGVLNQGNPITEVSADSLVHAEALDLPMHFRRFFAQITAIGGAATAVTAYITAAKAEN